MRSELARSLASSRRHMVEGLSIGRKVESEGGCGVIGAASSIPIEGRYLLQALYQMRNRGNGKGGGIAAVGLVPEQMGVPRRVLEEYYLIQVAYLDPYVRKQVEDDFIYSPYDVYTSYKVDSVADYRDVEGLEVKPPDVYRYFVRVKERVLERFVEERGLRGLERGKAEDEFVWQNSFMLNKRFYSSLGEKKAFVLSHGKNMMVLKLVGYGHHVIKYYRLEGLKAHVWIGHHRYPTKGKVWHPGGAHPFIGLHHALVHNGDFSNYHPIAEYLAERNMYPLFLTDTEVAALLFDLLYRQYEYPLEYLLEAMAPTTERDFYMLPPHKRRLYGEIQKAHIHASPDGPWFFIVAGNDPYKKEFQLIGITDTSMLRPQVFALQEGDVKIGIVASERQAINAMLRKLAEDGKIPCPLADKYWVARGGSHTDGGAFIYKVNYYNGNISLVCTDKFGREIKTPYYQVHFKKINKPLHNPVTLNLQHLLDIRTYDPKVCAERIVKIMAEVGYEEVCWILDYLKNFSKRDHRSLNFSIEALTWLLDLRYDTGKKKPSSVRALVLDTLNSIFSSIPRIGLGAAPYCSISWDSRDKLVRPLSDMHVLVIDGEDFPSEGDESLARFLVSAYNKGWRKLVVFNARGQRFLSCGLGPNSYGTRIDIYGDPGDYLASGLDGAEVYVHGPAQDQAGQIFRSGKLVVYGDVGQTFMYGSKGGYVFVQGNAAGRPMINAVGKPRVVINGTCLDYLAESFMAGDPLNGGGFVILNGIAFDDHGKIVDLDTPYPGGNLLSLASGGAIYIRDPYRVVEENQLHGGKLSEVTEKDWDVMYGMLRENEDLFGITIERLLTVDGKVRMPWEVYRKVEPETRKY